ncbi:AsmA family protein [Notoacmeibacter marinus]|uniref:AsmA family protein n=1 Tax=Notoacmeibacter marinus TaxID=1876515 RepID=UPI000DF41663|nr:AsmA family protein [Notoacmeibacter marinus]
MTGQRHGSSGRIILARLLVFIGGLLVLVLAAAAIVPPFIDWTDYRSRFEAQSSQLLGRPVSVDGQTAVRLLPFPSITFHDVTVADDEGEPIFVAETFSLDAELGPLLSGEFRIFDMRMDSPLLMLTAHRDGRIDWPFKLRIPDQLQQITVESLAIEGGAIFVTRGEGRPEVRIDDIDAQLSARSLGGPWQAEGQAVSEPFGSLAFTLSTGTGRADGSVGLSVRLKPAKYPASLAIDGALRADNGLPRLDGTFRLTAAQQDSEDDAPAAVRINGTLAATPNSLVSDKLRLETGAAETPYAATGSGAFDLGDTPKFTVRLKGDTLGGALSENRGDDDELRGTIGDGENRFGRTDPISPAEIRQQILTFFQALPAPLIDGRLDLRLPAIIDGATTIRDVVLEAEARDRQWLINKLAADLPGRTRLEAEGSLRTGDKPGFDGRVVLAVRQPGNFLSWLGVERHEALASLSAAGFETDLSLGPDSLRLSNLELAIGPSRLTGAVERTDEGNIVADLRTDGLGETAIDLFLGFIDEIRREGSVAALTLSLSGGPFVHSGLAADNGKVRLTAGGGSIDIAELRLDNFAGSQVEGTGRIENDDTGARRIALDLTALSEDFSGLTAALRRVPAFERLAALGNRRLRNAPSLGRNGRFVLSITGDPEAALTVDFNGETAAAELSGTAALQMDRSGLPLRSGSVSLRAEGLRPTVAALGLEVLPLDTAGRYAIDATLSEDGQVNVQLQGDDVVGQADLILRDDGVVAGGVSLQTSNILPVTQLLGWAAPTDAPSLAFGLESEVVRDGNAFDLASVTGNVGDTAYSGALTVDIGATPPNVAGRLKTDRLDLGPLFARLMGGELPPALQPPALAGGEGLTLGTAAEDGTDMREPSSVRFDDTDFALPQTLPFHGELSVESTELRLGRLAAQAARLTIEATDERLAFRDVRANRAGAPIGGSATFTRSGPSLLTDIEANISALKLADHSGGYLDGAVDLSLQLTGGGRDPAGLVRSLSGSVTVTPVEEHVAVRGFATDILGQTLARADRVSIEQRDSNAPVDPTASIAPAVELARSLIGNGEAVELTIEPSVWTVASGVVRSPLLNWVVPGGSLSGTMTYQLALQQIDADLRLILEPLGETAMASLKPAIGIRLSGPPEAAEASIYTTLLEQYLTLRAVEREQARLEALEKRIAEEAARRKAEAEERRRQQEAEAKRRAEEEARLKAEEEARRKAEEEAARKRAAEEEEARRRAAEEEAERLRQERQRLEEKARAASREPSSPALAPEDRLQLEGLVPDLLPDG